jgi:methylmalonyl-CoA mutase cobalamin-binding subunit
VGVRVGARRVRGSRRSREDAMPRIVIAAGGTAGHVVPALAVADALRERGAEVEGPPDVTPTRPAQRGS